MIKVQIAINGGPVNIYSGFGLTHNPFPAIPHYGFATANRMLRELDGEPLDSIEDVKRILEGCDEEFIALCCRQFRKGERIVFTVQFPE